jgi:hypothetical protein
VKLLRSVAEERLEWCTTRVSPWFKTPEEFLLRSGDEVAGVLRLHRAVWGWGAASAEAAEGTWTFTRGAKPFWLGTWALTVRITSDNVAVATLIKPHLFRDETLLLLPNGRAFRWRGRWAGGEWECRHPDGGIILRAERTAPWVSRLAWRTAELRGIVTVEPTAASIEELPLLVLLGWYLATFLPSSN